MDGVKVSLLDAAHEIALRAALPEGVRLYTGDDFNYPELIDGDGTHHSDALLGIFAAIYPAASAALQSYDAGDAANARAILDSTRDWASTSSAHPRSTTRPASRSCPGSTAGSPASRWWAACSPAGPWCTWPGPSNWQTRPDC